MNILNIGHAADSSFPKVEHPPLSCFCYCLATAAYKSAVLRSRTRFLAMFSTHTPKPWLRTMILSRQKVDHAASYRAQVLPK